MDNILLVNIANKIDIRRISEREDNRLFITLVPKVLYNNVILFVGLTTLVTLKNFDWLDHKVKCANMSTNNLYPLNGLFCVSSMYRKLDS